MSIIPPPKTPSPSAHAMRESKLKDTQGEGRLWLKNEPQWASINPEWVRTLDHTALLNLAKAIREKIILQCSQSGGHLGASLGVVELSIALHRVWQTPHDLLVWDIGHQTYAHKLLTGRGDAFGTLRQEGGLSGFLSRQESPYDTFGAGHSSTSISAATGMIMAAARSHISPRPHVVCVIGDSALGAGMAYEALNHAGDVGLPLVVVLNDNAMSISPPVGAIRHHLERLRNKPLRLVRKIEHALQNVLTENLSSLSNPLKALRDHIKQTPPVRAMGAYIDSLDEGAGRDENWEGFFASLGFGYIGPVDGHDMVLLEEKLTHAKQIGRPMVVHVHTSKGLGFAPAEAAIDKMHGVAAFDLTSGYLSRKPQMTYSDVFALGFMALAAQDDRAIVITAAMLQGTGLQRVHALRPNQCVDVGIAEQHAVTLAAGMSTQGVRPWVSIYSTFLQRAYDQVVHDVALQNLPVRFAIDRAGYVGADGATHAGLYDMAILGCLPQMCLLAPSNPQDLVRMIGWMHQKDDGPVAVRFARMDAGPIAAIDEQDPVSFDGAVCDQAAKILHQHSRPTDVSPHAHAEVLAAWIEKNLKEGASHQGTFEPIELLAASTQQHPRCILAAVGASVAQAMILGRQWGCAVWDVRTIKPWPLEWMESLLRKGVPVILIEEASPGSFGAYMAQAMINRAPDVAGNLHLVHAPDSWTSHASVKSQWDQSGLAGEPLALRIQAHLDRWSPSPLSGQR